MFFEWGRTGSDSVWGLSFGTIVFLGTIASHADHWLCKIFTVQYNYITPKKKHDNMQQNSAEKYFIWSAFAGVLDILSSQKSAL